MWGEVKRREYNVVFRSENQVIPYFLIMKLSTAMFRVFAHI